MLLLKIYLIGFLLLMFLTMCFFVVDLAFFFKNLNQEKTYKTIANKFDLWTNKIIWDESKGDDEILFYIMILIFNIAWPLMAFEFIKHFYSIRHEILSKLCKKDNHEIDELKEKVNLLSEEIKKLNPNKKGP